MAAFTRRDVMRGLGALACGGAVPASAVCPVPGLPPRFCFEPAPFPLGVASGDPTPHSVILWTRLAVAPLAPDGGLAGEVPVEWAVARDPAMRHVVAHGRAVAQPASGYAVHVDAGGLRPATPYFYRFTAGTRASRIGRTRTAPAGRTASLRFACVSCQDFVSSYEPFRHLAREPLDAVVHLGDAIYEHALGPPPRDLASYRGKHAIFRGDPLAREAWAAHPFLVTWDDHEIAADYCGADSRHDALRRAGYQAYYEHMPLRLPEGPPPDWKDLRIYRHAPFGDLLELDLLDLRQYRDPHPATSAQALAPGRTLLGERQRRWLFERLGRRTAAWSCIGSPVPMTDYDGNVDVWSGYAHERWEVLRHVRGAAGAPLVVVAGDRHRAVVSRLLVSDDGPRFSVGAPAVAVEFGTPALSSRAPFPASVVTDALDPDARAPWVLYADRGNPGYLLCDVTPELWRSTYRVLRQDWPDRLVTLASFQVTRDGTVASARGAPAA